VAEETPPSSGFCLGEPYNTLFAAVKSQFTDTAIFQPGGESAPADRRSRRGLGPAMMFSAAQYRPGAPKLTRSVQSNEADSGKTRLAVAPQFPSI
jgi:hypothetical protein